MTYLIRIDDSDIEDCMVNKPGKITVVCKHLKCINQFCGCINTRKPTEEPLNCIYCSNVNIVKLQNRPNDTYVMFKCKKCRHLIKNKLINVKHITNIEEIDDSKYFKLDNNLAKDIYEYWGIFI